MTGRKINIAIDGHSGCGKSTTARAVARLLGYTYIDTGAMYRAVTLYFLHNRISLDDPAAIRLALDSIRIHFEQLDNGQTHTFLNGKDVEDAIRSPEIAEIVSQVSAISSVRRAMVLQQQKLGQSKGVVMDGRDITTVVFPEAELKIFMTADPAVRAKRRRAELKAGGVDVDESKILNNLLMRDRLDSTREDSPLLKTEGAFEIDTTHISLEEQIEKVYSEAKKIIHKQED